MWYKSRSTTAMLFIYLGTTVIMGGMYGVQYGATFFEIFTGIHN